MNPREGLTRGQAVKQVFFTKKPDALYAITPGWPGRQLVVRNVNVSAKATVTLLGVQGQLKSRMNGNTLTIEVPDLNPDQAPCRYAFAFKIPGATVLPEK